MAGQGDFLTIDRSKLDGLARRAAAAKIQALTIRTAALAATSAPGSMKQKIRPIFRGSKANPVGIVMVDHPAAHFVFNGTRPHEIRPKRSGGVLRFRIGSTVVYARHVNHPGTKPNPFLWRALLAAKFNA
jgi:hypothetical protein